LAEYGLFVLYGEHALAFRQAVPWGLSAIPIIKLSATDT